MLQAVVPTKPGNTSAHRNASYVLYFVILGMMGAASLYTFLPILVPWHAARMGLKEDHGLAHNEEIACPDTMIVMWALYRVAGVEGWALCIVMYLIMRGPFQEGEPWSWWAVLVITSFSQSVTIIVALFVDYRITPWQAPLLALILSLAALKMCAKDFSGGKDRKRQ